MVAAVAFVVLSDDKKDDDKKESKVTLSLRDGYRVWDSWSVKTTESAETSADVYYVTSISNGIYDISVTSDSKGFTPTVVAISESVLKKLCGLDHATSEMTKVGTNTKDTQYGKIDLDRYTYTDTEGTVSTYDIVPNTTICLFKTETKSGSSTAVETTYTSTTYLIDGKEQSVSAPTTKKLTQREDIKVDDGKMMVNVSTSDPFGDSDDDAGMASTITTVTAVSDDSLEVTVITSEDGEINRETNTVAKSDFLAVCTIANYDGATKIGTEIVITQYGFIECDKYSYDSDGVTMWFFVESGSGMVLMGAGYMTVSGETEYLISYVTNSLFDA